MKAWEIKAHKLISEYAMDAYRRANRKGNGAWRRRHCPYRLPAVAEELVELLGAADRVAAEFRAKQIFMYELTPVGDPTA